MISPDLNGLLRGHVPEPHCAIIGAGKDLSPIWEERSVSDWTIMPLKTPENGSRAEIKDLNETRGISGNEKGSVLAV